MCKYCERRTDVKLGWDQPELPWHHNQDITRNISGNMIHTDDTVGVIHDYQTASPVLIIKDKSCFGSEEDGVGTIYIPIKFCPECGAPKPAEEKPAELEGWTCSCGTVNQGKFCMNCGAKKPEGAPLYRCDKCGWEPEDPTHPPKFCPECGDIFDENDRQ